MARIDAVSVKPAVLQDKKIEKMMIEVDSPLGRDVLELDLNNSDSREKLKFFLYKNGFNNTEPQAVIERVKTTNAMSLDN